MYDPEGYSLWFCDYKYNDENTVSFVTLNKVSGFLQRMDLARKYAFGKMLVIGSEAPFKVKGLWLFRGQEIPQFVMDECYDMELYEWKKVDISDEAQKERVNQMIEDQEPFEGEALLDAKCFKWEIDRTSFVVGLEDWLGRKVSVDILGRFCFLPSFEVDFVFYLLSEANWTHPSLIFYLNFKPFSLASAVMIYKIHFPPFLVYPLRLSFFFSF